MFAGGASLPSKGMSIVGAFGSEEQCRLSHRSLAAPSCQQMSELEEAEVRLVDSIRLGLQLAGRAMDGYHKPDQQKLQALKDTANRLRISSIQATTAAGSG
ncbi:hypothetical protein QTO34_006965 [Cnephaeus nilssonii]|uniref:Uncharacterized protein n=1 Tax=Cnephaeus nilssonii TaxID=3371016 RepID=A0AA40HK46_CNENI|nr:hypothetical protein QTO34_006965 [Eptesicus nilssonii]